MKRWLPKRLWIALIVCTCLPPMLLGLIGAGARPDGWRPAGLTDQSISDLHITSAGSTARTLWAVSDAAGLWQRADASRWKLAETRRGAGLSGMIELSSGWLVAGVAGQLALHDPAGAWESLPAPWRGSEALLAEAADGRLFALVGADLWASSDNGHTWQTQGHLTLGDAPTYLAADLLGRDTLVVGTRAGNLVVSRTLGRTWETPRGIQAGASVQALMRTEGDAVLAATSKGILTSSDGGATWSVAAATLQGRDARFLLRGSAGSHTVYAALGSGGVYVSADDGRSWAPLGAGLARRRVYALAWAPEQQLLYAGTDRGVWQLDLVGAGVATAQPSATRPAPSPSAPGPTASRIATRPATRTPSATPSPPATATGTARPSATATFTAVPSQTATPTPSPWPTDTATATGTATATATPIPPTAEPTATVGLTWTSTPEQSEPQPTPPR